MVEVSGGTKLAGVIRAMADAGQFTEVSVGFLDGATYPDGTPVAQVAAWNNFGAPGAGIPARPFFTQMVQENGPHWGEAFAGALKMAEGDTDKALALMGVKIAGQLRDAIEAANVAANSPVTDLLFQRFPKGGQTFADVQQARADVAAGETAPAKKPLVWTSHMLNSVDFEVK